MWGDYKLKRILDNLDELVTSSTTAGQWLEFRQLMEAEHPPHEWKLCTVVLHGIQVMTATRRTLHKDTPDCAAATINMIRTHS